MKPAQANAGGWPSRTRMGPHATHEGEPIMRKVMNSFALAAAILALARCDFLDPTDVTNPTVTEDDFVQGPDAAENWTLGVERQLASAVDALVVHSELASDNLYNNRTLINRTFDIPQMPATDHNVLETQQEVHALRAMANQGLEVVVEEDPDTTDELRARLHYARGYAYLAGGEYFVGLPVEENGPVEGPETHLNRAVSDFERVGELSSDADLQAAAALGVARAHHRLGNLDEAVAAADEVRSSAPELRHVVEFDDTDGPTNTMQFAIYDSGQNEFQPLPRLDFLFPKYHSVTAGDESPISIAKGEEAFLILAEARIAENELDDARTLMEDLLDLVEERATELVDDTHQARGRAGGDWIYPNSSEVAVAASPEDDAREGLVLDREDGPVEVPVISGTSVTGEMISAAGTEEELLELLYLMRQEIFVVEGRRMTDLGVRIPLSVDEVDANDNADGGAYVEPQIPPWIPLDYGLNRFDYEDGDDVAVIHHNMNRVLVEERASDLVLPFH